MSFSDNLRVIQRAERDLLVNDELVTVTEMDDGICEEGSESTHRTWRLLF